MMLVPGGASCLEMRTNAWLLTHGYFSLSYEVCLFSSDSFVSINLYFPWRFVIMCAFLWPGTRFSGWLFINSRFFCSKTWAWVLRCLVLLTWGSKSQPKPRPWSTFRVMLSTDCSSSSDDSVSEMHLAAGAALIRCTWADLMITLCAISSKLLLRPITVPGPIQLWMITAMFYVISLCQRLGHTPCLPPAQPTPKNLNLN